MIRKEVKPIMVMMLGDGEVAVKHHPVNEIRELAHTASNAFGWLSVRNGQPFLIPSAGSGSSDEFPDREGFAWTNEHSIDVSHGKSEIDSLVFLQLHVHISQTTANEGVVAIDDDGQRVLCFLLCKTDTFETIVQMSFQNFFLNGKTIGEWGYFTKQFSCHKFLLDMIAFCAEEVEQISHSYIDGLIGRTSELASLTVIVDVAQAIVIASMQKDVTDG